MATEQTEQPVLLSSQAWCNHCFPEAPWQFKSRKGLGLVLLCSCQGKQQSRLYVNRVVSRVLGKVIFQLLPSRMRPSLTLAFPFNCLLTLQLSVLHYWLARSLITHCPPTWKGSRFRLTVVFSYHVSFLLWCLPCLEWWHELYLSCLLIGALLQCCRSWRSGCWGTATRSCSQWFLATEQNQPYLLRPCCCSRIKQRITPLDHPYSHTASFSRDFIYLIFFGRSVFTVLSTVRNWTVTGASSQNTNNTNKIPTRFEASLYTIALPPFLRNLALRNPSVLSQLAFHTFYSLH